MQSELIESWREDEAAPFRGWDFSYIADRRIEERPPWDYPGLARSLVDGCRAMLDMATGGGEVLSSLGPFPPTAVAIEGYEPNVALARERLEPLGVSVVEAGEVEPLPFDDGAFDVVLNRHGGLRVGEIHRVLGSGGRFLTQQVGGDSLHDLLAWFGAKPKWPDNVLRVVEPELRELGFEIERAVEWRGTVRFLDVGAVVYLLKAVPWLVADFSVDTHLERLVRLHDALRRNGELRFTATRFLVLAMKP